MIQNKTFFGITIASILVLGGFSFSDGLLPEADASSYIDFDGINVPDINSKSPNPGWSNLYSFSFDIQKDVRIDYTSKDGSATLGPLEYSVFTITKSVDAASPQIFDIFTEDNPSADFHSVHLNIDLNDAVSDSLNIDLVDASVVRYDISTDSSGVPIETISLVYEQIHFNYVSIDGTEHPTG